MKNKNKKFNKPNITSAGFTLIELLVVISIITLLASLMLVQIKQARVKARDANRMQTLLQMNTAVELYALNNGGSYFVPSAAHCYDSSLVSHCGRAYSCESWDNWPDEFRNAMAPYINMSQDPLPICTGSPVYRKYVYMSDGRDFKLQFLYPEDSTVLKARMDPTQDGGPTNVGGNGPNPGSCNGPGDGSDITAWAIYTPGAECWSHW